MEQNTIAAISTAPGRAGLAVVRVSGPDAERIAEMLGFPDLPDRAAVFGRLRHPEDGRQLDRVVVTRFAAPASYTGQTVLEISCHGGALVPALVLDAVCAAGARPAEPGEFARRAFLNGKLDLIQVEATLDLIDARSEASHATALFQLDGGLSARISELRERLLGLQAMLSYEIDFPEEDDGPIADEDIRRTAQELSTELDELLLHAPDGELVREGALTVIAGKPNSGKSSLFNSLLGKTRAIVTEIPGTTRDAIEAVISISGYPFRLVDTAGLRDDADYVEGMGIEVARRYLEHADLVVFCVEADRSLESEEVEFLAAQRERRAVVQVRTKSDLRPEEPSDPDAIAVSAQAATGMDRLREVLLQAAFSGARSATDTPLLTRRRHVRQVRLARQEVGQFLDARDAGLPPEIASTYLQDATVALEALIGAVETEDVLDLVFSSFCIGK
jgi:tRNA modification GTPase